MRELAKRARCATSLRCMIYALGSVSGAHFHPAVTTAAICSGRDKFKPQGGALYMVAQVLKAVLACIKNCLIVIGPGHASCAI